MNDRISIIVSTYKRKDQLKRLLESFSRLRSTCALEFIIVDSASCDGTEDVVKNWIPAIDFADVKYIPLKKRVPLARSRNIGILQSTGNVIAFTDDDCTVDPGWIDALYRQLVSSPDYAGVGGRVLPAGNDLYSRYHTIYQVLEPSRDLLSVVGASCMFRKQPVIDAGMFDEYFVRLGGEETALCMKLGLKGYRFGFTGEAVVFHEYRKSLWDFIKTFYYYGNGDRVLYTRSLEGYLRYRPYPEKIHNYVAFRNHAAFLLLFLRDMVHDIARQRKILFHDTSSLKERLLLNCLYAIHQVSFNLGRGTFSGTLAKTVERYLAGHPGGLLTVDSGTKTSSPVLEIVSDRIPSVLKTGETADSSLVIRNPSRDHYISAKFVVILQNKEDGAVFYRSPVLQDMLFFPMTDSVFLFSLYPPVKEQKIVLEIFLSTQQGDLISNKQEKTITIVSGTQNTGKKGGN